jgi:hypothetical protein
MDLDTQHYKGGFYFYSIDGNIFYYSAEDDTDITHVTKLALKDNERLTSIVQLADENNFAYVIENRTRTYLCRYQYGEITIVRTFDFVGGATNMVQARINDVNLFGIVTRSRDRRNQLCNVDVYDVSTNQFVDAYEYEQYNLPASGPLSRPFSNFVFVGDVMHFYNVHNLGATPTNAVIEIDGHIISLNVTTASQYSIFGDSYISISILLGQYAVETGCVTFQCETEHNTKEILTFYVNQDYELVYRMVIQAKQAHAEEYVANDGVLTGEVVRVSDQVTDLYVSVVIPAPPQQTVFIEEDGDTTVFIEEDEPTVFIELDDFLPIHGPEYDGG